MKVERIQDIEGWKALGGKTLVNNYNVEVNKGCVSCRFANRNGDYFRCSKHGFLRKATELCDDFILREGLWNAGKGTGRVRHISQLKPDLSKLL